MGIISVADAGARKPLSHTTDPAAGDPFGFALLRNRRDTRPRPFRETWGAFVRLVAGCAARPRGTKDGLAWCPAAFDGGGRGDGNVTAVTAAVLDLDAVSYAPRELRRRLAGLGRAALAHTTFRSAPGAWRWRVVVPLAVPVPPAALPGLLEFVGEATGLVRDTTCTNPARLYYLPGDGARVLEFVGDRLAYSPPAGLVGAPSPARPPKGGKPSRDVIISTRFTRLPGGGETVPPDTGKPLTLDEVTALYAVPGVGERLADYLGLPLKGGFRSPLPWREDARPSCGLHRADGGELLLTDHGRDGGTFNLALFAMTRAHGRRLVKGDYRTELLLWRVRLLVEAGIIAPDDVYHLPPCPDPCPPTVRRVYDGFKLLLQCKGRVREWGRVPTAFAKGFAAAWCGVSELKAHQARLRLADAGIIHICGTYKRTCLYYPGPHPGHPTYEEYERAHLTFHARARPVRRPAYARR
jgi:hypothetical protein